MSVGFIVLDYGSTLEQRKTHLSIRSYVRVETKTKATIESFVGQLYRIKAGRRLHYQPVFCSIQTGINCLVSIFFFIGRNKYIYTSLPSINIMKEMCLLVWQINN